MEQLVERWERWVRSVAGARTRRAWQQEAPALAGWQPHELRRPVGGARTDRMQAALVARAQGGDEAATLTLVVQFEPALRRLSAGRTTRTGSRAEAEADVIGTFVEVALGHDLTRRPARIAANLVWDTRQRLHRADRRWRAVATDQARIEQASPCTPDADLGADAVDLIVSLAEALDGLGGDVASRRLTRELAVRAWVLDETTVELAEGLGLAPSAVRARLCRLRSSVRQCYASEAA
ncbi:MAG: hypothetical protein AAFN30_08675 [Actinomycetota bacterium]